METKIVVAGGHLVVPYKEIKLFKLLPEVYPQDFVIFSMKLLFFNFLSQNCFRFLDDIFHKWLQNFDNKTVS